MPSDGVTARYQPARGPPRRVRYEARTPEGYWRVTEEWTGCTWHVTGREPVVALSIEVGHDLLDDVVDVVGEPGSAAETVPGPGEVRRR